MRNAKARGDVNSTSLTSLSDQIGNKLNVVLSKLSGVIRAGPLKTVAPDFSGSTLVGGR